jgi:xanthine/CO dehydrogenase XdhC/CoxF family maturation factor
MYLAAEGIRPDERLHTPVGLDLGAVEPEAIALSILAEIQAFLRGKSAQSLGAKSMLVSQP